MKRYIAILVIVLIALVAFTSLTSNKRFNLEDVEEMTIKKTTESGMVEEKMNLKQTQELKDILHSLELKPKENDNKKGWQLCISCYDENGKHMYDIYLINNIIKMDDECYELSRVDMNKLIKYVEDTKDN